jgi:hypothetical protein
MMRCIPYYMECCHHLNKTSVRLKKVSALPSALSNLSRNVEDVCADALNGAGATDHLT